MSEVFLSIGEAPLDAWTMPDVGDDLPFTEDTAPYQTLAESKLPFNDGTVAPPYVLPFQRVLGLGDVGKDVVGAKRAIWNANGLAVPTRATEKFGLIAVKELKRFQRAHGLTADGVLGPASLKKLAPYFDAYAYLLYVGYAPGSTPRDRIIAYVMWGYNNRGAIGYSQYRPMSYMNSLMHLPINEDCSTFATKAYKYAGAIDPNGLHYNGYGNTGTMRQHGYAEALQMAIPGDLAHYDRPQHVAVYVGHGRVVSLGSTIGPLLLSVTYRPLAEMRRYL